ncbi:hypothetical protein M8818_000041 [Zalaria obscura]|uniref:Uncharacterized protein n=1 Tax=Zalaria obscura TaxID=2024903 RepID=A0ACC3SNI4_9PEZI
MVGFGISIGDCIALVQILYQSIEAFNETRGAVTHYQGVIQSLKNIECALAPLHNREIREPTLKAAIEKVTNQCSKAIHAFIISNGKYSSLTQNDDATAAHEETSQKLTRLDETVGQQRAIFLCISLGYFLENKFAGKAGAKHMYETAPILIKDRRTAKTYTPRSEFGAIFRPGRTIDMSVAERVRGTAYEGSTVTFTGHAVRESCSCGLPAETEYLPSLSELTELFREVTRQRSTFIVDYLVWDPDDFHRVSICDYDPSFEAPALETSTTWDIPAGVTFSPSVIVEPLGFSGKSKSTLTYGWRRGGLSFYTQRGIDLR